MPIKIALPKGPLLNETARWTSDAGWQMGDYSENARLYHLSSARFASLSGKILQEKDIPIQVAMGNYDLGICGLDWIQELMVKYPASNLVKIKDLCYGGSTLFLAAARTSPLATIEAVRASDGVISIASEYPNLAESLALNGRFKRFNIFPVWGAAEIYPPENADLVLISSDTPDLESASLLPLARVLDSTAYLIASKTSWETRDLSEILNTAYVKPKPLSVSKVTQPSKSQFRQTVQKNEPPSIRLALPDGHQQKHVVNLFIKANIKIKDYPSETGNRRPEIDIPGIDVKVIRPQDMPLQVANGKFDIAVTGQDWVKEHLYQFPSSPVCQLADLKYGRVKIVAAVHHDLPVSNISDLRRFAAAKGGRIRVASEYVWIADKYARDNRLGMYRIIPTWGATEAFLPDDADMLIENTETGSTLQRHNLKIIETLFESTACLIANTEALKTSAGKKIETMAAVLRTAVE